MTASRQGVPAAHETLVSSSQTPSKANITCCTVPNTPPEFTQVLLQPQGPELKLLLERITPTKGEQDKAIHFFKENPLIYEPITSPLLEGCTETCLLARAPELPKVFPKSPASPASKAAPCTPPNTPGDIMSPTKQQTWTIWDAGAPTADTVLLPAAM